MKLVRHLALATLGIATFSSSAWARDFQIAPDNHSETFARFNSMAAIVRFSGSTREITGGGFIDVDSPSTSPAGGTVSVDLKSLDTGLGLRNDHMREVLETEKFPKATFRMKSLKSKELVANQPVKGEVTGEFTLHGMTRTLTAPVTLVYLPESALSEADRKRGYRKGDWVSVMTQFGLELSDYGVKLPEGVLGVKVSDHVDVELQGMARGI